MKQEEEFKHQVDVLEDVIGDWESEIEPVEQVIYEEDNSKIMVQVQQQSEIVDVVDT